MRTKKSATNLIFFGVNGTEVKNGFIEELNNFFKIRALAYKLNKQHNKNIDVDISGQFTLKTKEVKGSLFSLGSSHNDITFSLPDSKNNVEKFGILIKAKTKDLTNMSFNLYSSTLINLAKNNGEIYKYFDVEDVKILKYYYQNAPIINSLSLGGKGPIDKDFMVRLANYFGYKNLEYFLRISTNNLNDNVLNVYFILNKYVIPSYILLKVYRDKLTKGTSFSFNNNSTKALFNTQYSLIKNVDYHIEKDKSKVATFSSKNSSRNLFSNYYNKPEDGIYQIKFKGLYVNPKTIYKTAANIF